MTAMRARKCVIAVSHGDRFFASADIGVALDAGELRSVVHRPSSEAPPTIAPQPAPRRPTPVDGDRRRATRRRDSFTVRHGARPLHSKCPPLETERG